MIARAFDFAIAKPEAPKCTPYDNSRKQTIQSHYSIRCKYALTLDHEQFESDSCLEAVRF